MAIVAIESIFMSCYNGGSSMTVYIETARLKLRDWQEEDLLPLQQLNANRQVRQYFPSLLSYENQDLILKR